MSLDLAKARLREDYRIKEGVDYGLIFKYGDLVLTCHAVYFEVIVATFRDCGVQIKKAFVYDERSW